MMIDSHDDTNKKCEILLNLYFIVIFNLIFYVILLSLRYKRCTNWMWKRNKRNIYFYYDYYLLLTLLVIVYWYLIVIITTIKVSLFIYFSHLTYWTCLQNFDCLKNYKSSKDIRNVQKISIIINNPHNNARTKYIHCFNNSQKKRINKSSKQ